MYKSCFQRLRYTVRHTLLSDPVMLLVRTGSEVALEDAVPFSQELRCSEVPVEGTAPSHAAESCSDTSDEENFELLPGNKSRTFRNLAKLSKRRPEVREEDPFQLGKRD